MRAVLQALSEGRTVEEIAASYPDTSPADIRSLLTSHARDLPQQNPPTDPRQAALRERSRSGRLAFAFLILPVLHLILIYPPVRGTVPFAEWHVLIVLPALAGLVVPRFTPESPRPTLAVRSARTNMLVRLSLGELSTMFAVFFAPNDTAMAIGYAFGYAAMIRAVGMAYARLTEIAEARD